MFDRHFKHIHRLVLLFAATMSFAARPAHAGEVDLESAGCPELPAEG